MKEKKGVFAGRCKISLFPLRLYCSAVAMIMASLNCSFSKYITVLNRYCKTAIFLAQKGNKYNNHSALSCHAVFLSQNKKQYHATLHIKNTVLIFFYSEHLCRQHRKVFSLNTDMVFL